MKYNKQPICNNINIRETIKVADIQDAFGNLKYKVSLTSHNIPFNGLVRQVYEVQVINCFSAPEPLIILQKPAEDETNITNYNYALAFYKHCIKQYSRLVKAETRDFQDISVTNSKLNYKITSPKCCSTCKFARSKRTPGDYIENVTGRLECHHPLNIQSFSQDNFDCHCAEKHFHIVDNSKNLINIYPNVKPFGLCDGYVQCEVEIKPIHGDSLIDIIDHQIGYKLDDKIDEAVDGALNESIESDIIPKVGEAIDKKLKENPPIIIGDDQQFEDLVNDNNNDGIINKDDLNNITTFIGGGA